MNLSPLRILHCNVFISVNLQDPRVQAHKPNRSCVEVNWQAVDYGKCRIKYYLMFKGAYGWIFHEYTGYDVFKVVKCGFGEDVNIKQVELRISSTKRSRAFDAVVDESQLPTTKTITTAKTTTHSKIIRFSFRIILTFIAQNFSAIREPLTLW